jgi:hypothetical protein
MPKRKVKWRKRVVPPRKQLRKFAPGWRTPHLIDNAYVQQFARNEDMLMAIPCFLQGNYGNGLANRMRGWCGVGGMADMAHAPLWVDWHVTDPCPAKFEHLFIPHNCVVATPEILERLRDVRRFNKSQKDKDAWRAIGVGVAFRYLNMVPSNKRLELSKLIALRTRSFRLIPELQTKLDAFVATLPPVVIGVHVRRTDFGPVRNRDMADLRLLQVLEDEISRTPEARFLVCADNKASVDWLMNTKFGNRVLWRPQEMNAALLRHSAAQDAVLDMFALAHCKHIVGQDRSSFCVSASQLRGIPIRKIPNG